jgi:RNA polymerase sigma-70 factor (ECF subfamily)
LALLVVLDSLTPAERVAFVLHDLFAVPFDEIAPIVGRSTDAAKQLASRARRRVQGTGEDDTTPDRRRQREVVEAFLAASRDGDFEALLRLLDPDVVVRADAACAAMGGPRELRGVADVAGFFDGKARAMRLALVDGEPGWVWTLRGQTKVVCRFTVREGKVSGIEMVADEGEVARTELTFLPGLR